MYVCHYDVGIEALPSPILNITTTTTTTKRNCRTVAMLYVIKGSYFKFQKSYVKYNPQKFFPIGW